MKNVKNKYFNIVNNSELIVDFKETIKKLSQFCHMIDDSKFPVEIQIMIKSNFLDRSHFNLETNEIVLKFDKHKIDKKDYDWVLAHEFGHFLANNNPELKRVSESSENIALFSMLSKYTSMDVDATSEIFHDFLPSEVFANAFATLITGRYFKRHSFKYPNEILKKNGLNINDVQNKKYVKLNTEFIKNVYSKLNQKIKNNIDFTKFKIGFKSEVHYEDIATTKSLVLSDLTKISKIVSVHLIENPNYYDGVEKMEKKYIINENSSNAICPKCNSEKISGCRCSGPHDMKDLMDGHGNKCKNGHTFYGKKWIYSDKAKMLREGIHKYAKAMIKEVVDSIKEKSDYVPLHGDSTSTQREFVINLAKKNPMGLISISDISAALKTTNNEIKDTYARIIRYYNTKLQQDFVKVVPEVRYRTAAIYQLADWHNRIPLKKGTEEYKDVIKDEAHKYAAIKNGLFYNVVVEKRGNLRLVIGYIRLDIWEDPKEVEKELPPGYEMSETYYTRRPTSGVEISRKKMSDSNVNTSVSNAATQNITEAKLSIDSLSLNKEEKNLIIDILNRFGNNGPVADGSSLNYFTIPYIKNVLQKSQVEKNLKPEYNTMRLNILKKLDSINTNEMSMINELNAEELSGETIYTSIQCKVIYKKLPYSTNRIPKNFHVIHTKCKTIMDSFTVKGIAKKFADLIDDGHFKCPKCSGIPIDHTEIVNFIKASNINENGILTSVGDMSSEIDKIKKSINAPYVSVNVSTLGGEHRKSMIITISLDDRNSWINGIFENSNYMRFHLFNDGVINQFSLSFKGPKFRKTRYKNIDDAILKINKYLDSVKGNI